MTTAPGGWQYRRTQRAQLLRFAQHANRPEGFGYLGDAGTILPGRPVELWITCRMTHVFGLGVLADEPAAPGGPSLDEMRELATHGVAALLDGPLRDTQHGGWFAGVQDGVVSAATKQAYGHAFVVLAASTAVTAGIPRGEELLAAALQTHDERFWDESTGLVVEEWDPTWAHLDPYRGVNSTMHTVEAYLAAGAVPTGAVSAEVVPDPSRWHRRAARIATTVADWARGNSWRIPEHFDSDWQPLLEHNKDEPAHPFRPYGATVGHGLEWARLMATIHAVVDDDLGLLDAAVELAERAIADGWAVDGHDGFVYTTDWDGRPVVRERMHWVLAEAIATSTVLHWATGDPRHALDLERWWAYADRFLIDDSGQSWRHELAPDNTPSARTWPGRPDVYHAYQASLMADTLGTASFAAGVSRFRFGAGAARP